MSYKQGGSLMVGERFGVAHLETQANLWTVIGICLFLPHKVLALELMRTHLLSNLESPEEFLLLSLA